MLTFVLLAAALTVAGTALIAIPLLRAHPQGTQPAIWTALAAASVLMIGAAVLYVLWSNWPWRAPAPANSPATMVAQLARRLERNPDNLDGWLMLGRSYLALQEYPLAYRAYERADRLSGGKSAEALVGEAEALAMSDPAELEGRAARLIERALVVAPDSPKALFFGAAVAARRGDLPLARQRFVKVLATNPPDAVRNFLEQQIGAIDRQLKGTPAASAPGSAAAAGAGSNAAAEPAPSANVRVRLTLAAGLKGSSGPFPLFVFVRDPARAGPPLAVRRLASEFPQTVELTPKDAMMAGRSFGPGDTVTVVARIARSGNPVGASGDPYGEITYQVGKDSLAILTIDRLTP
jgi:cytochrome c-type biogenesis protein CcmH